MMTRIYSLFLMSMTLSAPVALGAQQPPAQPPPKEEPYVFKADVQLVSLTATIEDRDGRAVAGLRQQDFQVWEDGVLQQISVFHNDEKMPVSVGIVFDTSGSMVDKIDDVQDAVNHFVQTTNPEDDIFLLQFSGSTKLVQGFTSDRQQLRKAVDRLRPRGGTALYDAIIQGLALLQQGRHRKKALFVVTDGNDTVSTASLREAMASAQQSEAIIYALGIGHGEQGSFGHAGNSRDYVDIDVLNNLADATGGRAFLLEGTHSRNGVDQVDQAAQQVGAELRGQYTIAYKPVNKDKDGTYRKITIKVISHPDYQVRTRAGYFAPKQRASRVRGSTQGDVRSSDCLASCIEPPTVGGIDAAQTRDLMPLYQIGKYEWLVMGPPVTCSDRGGP